MTLCQTLYRLFAWKPSTLRRLKQDGQIVDGRIEETKITPDGLEQSITLQPSQPINFVKIEVKL